MHEQRPFSLVRMREAGRCPRYLTNGSASIVLGMGGYCSMTNSQLDGRLSAAAIVLPSIARYEVSLAVDDSVTAPDTGFRIGAAIR